MTELELTYRTLIEKYGMSITREEMAEITKRSLGWVDLRLKEGVGLPRFKKEGRAVLFPTLEVAKWLTSGNIQTA